MKMRKKLLPLELLLLAQIYAPNRLSAGALPQTHWGSLHRSPRPLSWFRDGPPGNGKEGGEGEKERGGGRRRDGKGGEGVPECPNAELASLVHGNYLLQRGYVLADVCLSVSTSPKPTDRTFGQGNHH